MQKKQQFQMMIICHSNLSFHGTKKRKQKISRNQIQLQKISMISRMGLDIQHGENPERYCYSSMSWLESYNIEDIKRNIMNNKHYSLCTCCKYFRWDSMEEE